MQTSVARLYAHILNFFLSSLKWYKNNCAVHAFRSIFQPWDLKFRHEYEAIGAESQQIGRLADVALKAEVRDTRMEVVQGTRHWELVRQEMNELRVDNQRLTRVFQARFGAMENSILGEWILNLLGAQKRASHALSKLNSMMTATLTGMANRHVQRDSPRLRIPTQIPKSSPPQSDALPATLELPSNLRGFLAILPVHADKMP